MEVMELLKSNVRVDGLELEWYGINTTNAFNIYIRQVQ